MGFFSSLLGGIGKVIKGVVKVGAGLLGVGAAPAATTVVRVAGPLAGVGARAVGGLRVAGRLATSLPGQLALTAGAAALGGVIGRSGAVDAEGNLLPGAVGGGGGRGNGQFVRQTTVQTFDLATGQVVRQQVFDGAPFLMNNEVQRLRTVARKLGRANAKLPRRTVKQSPLSELKDAAVSAALSNVRKGCPT